MFNNYLFRCSQLGKIMTDGRTKGTIGETCLKYLNEIYISEVYKRTNEVSSKFMEKGTLVEETSISLLSNVDKKLYFKYKGAPLKNEYVKGTPDIISGIDIKSSWNLYTFFNSEATKDNYWQAMGYMWLTGTTEWVIAYALVNSPEHIIEREEKSLFYKMGIDSAEHPDYLLAVAELRRNMVFDDIEETKRIKKYPIQYDESEIQNLQTRIIKCKEILNEMYKQNK